MAEDYSKPYFGNPNITKQAIDYRNRQGGYITPEQQQGLFSTLLDFTPVVGDIKSGIESLTALKQGNYLDAALSGVGVLPFIPSITKSIPTKQLENVLYRGTNDISQKSKSGFIWTSPEKEYAAKYGKTITEYKLPENAKLLDFSNLKPVERYDTVYHMLADSIGEKNAVDILNSVKLNSADELDVYSLFRKKETADILNKYGFDAVKFKQLSDNKEKTTVGILSKQKENPVSPLYADPFGDTTK